MPPDDTATDSQCRPAAGIANVVFRKHAVLAVFPARGKSDRRPLKNLRIKVSSASTMPLNVRGLSSAGARKNRCRQRNAVVGWTPHSFAVLARLLPSIIAWAWSSRFSFLRRCAIGVFVSALKVRRQLLQR